MLSNTAGISINVDVNREIFKRFNLEDSQGYKDPQLKQSQSSLSLSHSLKKEMVPVRVDW